MKIQVTVKPGTKVQKVVEIKRGTKNHHKVVEIV